MHRIRGIGLWSASLLLASLLAACGSQPPVQVVFHHRPPQSTAPASTVPQPASQAAIPLPDPAANIVIAPRTEGDVVTVQPGDTVYALSRRYNRPVRAIIDDNNLQPPYLLQSGQRIRIPGGRFHTVQPGETLYSISRAYGVDLYSTAQGNDLNPPYTIAVGQRLRIPATTDYAATSAPPPVAPSAAPGPAPRSSASGVQVEALPPPSAPSVSNPPASAPAAEPQKPEVEEAPPATQPAMPAQKPVPPEQEVATAAVPPKPEAALPPRSGRTFSWPVRGRILSTFGPKADGLHNDGINIAARAGAPVIAAENGVVVYAGNELRGFGNLLLVRHADGWITAYAHLGRMLVEKGQKVARGQAIGTVGSSGGVSQPQLHFEIRRGTRAVDPTKFLSVV